MKYTNQLIILSLLIFTISCSNKDSYDIKEAPRQIKFNTTAATLSVDNKDSTICINIGATSKQSMDESFMVSIEKNSNNAIEGTHFRMDLSNSVMKANEVITPFMFTALSNEEYQNGRVDTLVLSIADAKGVRPDFNDKLTLIIKK